MTTVKLPDHESEQIRSILLRYKLDSFSSLIISVNNAVNNGFPDKKL